MPQFAIMLRDAAWPPADLSPEEIQAVIEKYGAWVRRIGGSGHKLRDGEGRVMVRKDGGVSVTDGPYAEAKEIMGGFMIINANDYDEAVRHCQESPHLDYGSIEIRQVDLD
ncbi:MAG TPA: YciI family protein [Vicinamibacterales bacterium]|nr:YciI family protein [Vicinamibacterales bacterium]